MRYALLVLLLTGCAQPTVDISRLTPAQAHCYARARQAAASVSNPSLVWQMAIANETEQQVYAACMRGKQGG